MHTNPIPQLHYRRSKRLRVSQEWTDVIHRLYPACASDPEIVVALDPVSPYDGRPRWMFARRCNGWLLRGGTAVTEEYLHGVAYWLAQGDAFRPPTSEMAAFIAAFDTRNRHYQGELDDDFYPQADEAKFDAEWDESHRELYDQWGVPYPTREKLAPRLSNKYFGGLLA